MRKGFHDPRSATLVARAACRWALCDAHGATAALTGEPEQAKDTVVPDAPEAAAVICGNATRTCPTRPARKASSGRA